MSLPARRLAAALLPARSRLAAGARWLHHGRPSCSAAAPAGLARGQPATIGELPLNRWHVYAQLCLERFPVVAAEPTPLERQYQELCERVDYERSYLSEHELWAGEFERQSARAAEEGDSSNVDKGLATPEDYDDARQAELEAFERIRIGNTTEADASGARDTLHRALDRTVALAVRQQHQGTARNWHLPRVRRASGETMRQACERLLASALPADGSVRCHFMGRAPVAVYVKKYPERLQRDVQATGAKMFIYKARVSHYAPNAAYEPSNAEAEFERAHWLTRGEFLEVTSKGFAKVLRPILLQV